MARPAAPLPRLLFAFVAPFRAFLRTQSASGLALVAATSLALAWANSRHGAFYHDVVHAPVSVGAGARQLAWPLSHWVNDALMAVFFLLAGMEIKRELVVGELRTLRRAALPLVAALGGMLVPALIYAAINAGGAGAAGWAIPTATDIAFALGCLTLAGPRVPPSLGVFLAALAIFDDLGAILIIALFYGASLDLAALGVAALLALGLVALNRGGARARWPYLLVGVALWVALYRSGLHATLAGVALGLAIPARPSRRPTDVLDDLGQAIDSLHRARLRRLADAPASGTAAERGGAAGAALEAADEGVDGAIAAIERYLESVQSPLDRLRHGLHGPVSYGIVPLFALVNAGVTFGPAAGALVASPVALGAGLGLLVGKPVGVFGATFAAVRLGLAPRPAGTSWAHVFGAALLAGVGFTMSIFITGLAFSAEPATQDAAKAGVFAGSLAGAIAGLVVLRRAGGPARASGATEGEVRVLIDLPQFANAYQLVHWKPRGALIGRSLGELDVRGRYGVSVLGAWSGDEAERSPPQRKLRPVGGDYRIGPDDTLLLVGERDAVEAFTALDDPATDALTPRAGRARAPVGGDRRGDREGASNFLGPSIEGLAMARRVTPERRPHA